MHQKSTLIILLVILSLLGLVSCEKFEGSQTVPAYLTIDTIGLKVETGLQGSSSANITDAWVYVDDQLIGAFELPATIPLLVTGQHKVFIRPGIILNGMLSLRTYYPFYNSITKTLRFAPDSVTRMPQQSVNGKTAVYTTYTEKTYITWSENFDDQSLTIDTTSDSNVAFELTSSGDSNTFEGTFSGKIRLTSDTDVFEAVTTEDYALPQLAAPVFLEINYKGTNSFTIGVFATTSEQVVQQPVVDIYPKESWNKIYVNLTSIVSSFTTAKKFSIFIGATKDADVSTGEIYIDNMKLVYNNQTNE
jgi:hypothetical protein